MTIEELKYPIRKCVKIENVTSELISNFINVIELFPSRLRTEVENLFDDQLDTQNQLCLNFY